MPSRHTITRWLRRVGLVVCGAGLAAFYVGNIVQAAGGDRFAVPTTVWRAGVVAATAGCLLLLVLLARRSTRPPLASWEARLGFACLPAAMLSLFSALGEGTQAARTFWWAVTVILLPASLAVIALAATVARDAQENRSRADGSR